MKNKDQVARKKKILDLVAEYYKDFHKPGQLEKKEYVRTSGAKYGAEEMQSLVEVGLDFWLTEGRNCREFEKGLGEYLGLKFVSLTVSGSSANLLALTALTSQVLGKRRIKPGDEVITAGCGFPTTVNPIIQNGAIPVFVDVDRKTRNVTLEGVKKAIGPKTKAIMVAHTLGIPFPVEEIAQLAKENGLWLIEDSCDALGATYNGKKIATFGDLATFSFFPAHQITTGEGGAIVTNNALLYRCVNKFRDWGRDCWCAPGEDNTCGRRFDWQLGDLPRGYDHKYIYSEIGYNMRMTEMQAAIGKEQIKRIGKFVTVRRKNYRYLVEKLSKWQKYLEFAEIDKRSKPSPFGVTLVIKQGSKIKRAEMVDYLEGNGVATRMIFGGNLLKHPAYKNVKYRIVGDLKVSDEVLDRGLWVGCHPDLNKADLDKIVRVIGEFLESKVK